MYPHTSRTETRRWAVVLHHSKCSSDRPLSTLWETKERSLAHTFLGALCALSSHNVFFFVLGIKQYDLFFFISLLSDFAVYSLSGKLTLPRGWHIDISLVFLLPYVTDLPVFVTSMSVELKAWPSVFHLKVIRLRQYELLQLCLVMVWNCLFTPPAKREKTILAWGIVSMTMIFFAGLRAMKMRIVALRLLYTRPECSKTQWGLSSYE